MKIDIRLYGPLASYVDSDNHISAKLSVSLHEGCTVGDLLDELGIPTEKRGITFINGDLSAMPGMQPDLDHELEDGDRVAFFHTKSMWPFQYRHDVAALEEFKQAADTRGDGGLRSRYDEIGSDQS